MLILKAPDLLEKLSLLANGAKFDVSCASSGVKRPKNTANIGTASRFGICHSWTSDGRCISLLKVLLTNFCVYDCAYCINRAKNDLKRVFLKPEELARITYEFYRRNYIEGLFLSSGIWGNPDKTLELMIDTVKLLRNKYGFNGYVHLKILPNASKDTIREAIKWADRVSLNLELPSEKSLSYLCPNKRFSRLLETIEFIAKTVEELKEQLEGYNARAGQSTQLIIGATPDTDFEILKLSEFLYKKHHLKRVYYSAYISVNEDPRLPALLDPPLLREHRLYQADWLIRFYGFKVEELLSEKSPMLNEKLDPKLDWALRNLHLFPVDVMKADYYTLLRVPGIGPTSAKRILKHRRHKNLTFEDLKKLGVVLKRAKYFIKVEGKSPYFKVFEKRMALPKELFQEEPTQSHLFQESFS